MPQSRLDDLIDRLTSRKLWLALLSIGFAVWNYTGGRLTPVEFQTAVFASVAAFTLAEGVADAASAYRTAPSSPDQVVNVDASSSSPAVPPAPMLPSVAREARDR